MINLLNGFYRTAHPFSIEPQEPNADVILNVCRDWSYDKDSHVFRYITQSSGTGLAQIDDRYNVCLDDYSFETDLFHITLVPSYGRTNFLWQLDVQPIHPNANVHTVDSEFFVTDEEAEQLSRDPANIPNAICKKYCATEPFDQPMIEILNKTRMNVYPWGMRPFYRPGIPRPFGTTASNIANYDDCTSHIRKYTGGYSVPLDDDKE